MDTFAVPKCQSRDSIEDVWGPRTPYKHEWPQRADGAWDEEPDKWVQSACVMCSNGCALDIGVKDGKMVGVRGRETDRVNKGRLGPKGLHGWRSMRSADRLTHPLIRRNGVLQKATWDEAMTLLVEKSKNIMDKLTAHGIGYYTTGQLFLEEYYALALIGKAGLSTLHMDGNTRLCTATAAASMRESFGSDGQPGSYSDVDYTDCLFMVGHNVAATQTVLWSRILDRLDGPDPPKLIVVDPRLSDTARRATLHLAPKIGTNMALLNGIQHLLIKNDWLNHEFIDNHTVSFDDLKAKVAKYTPSHVEAITGVPAADLESAARILGTSRTLLSTALQGVYQSNQATASACQINNINLLLGQIGKPGAGVLQMNGQPTAQNNREVGCDGEFPGFRNHQNPAHMKELARLWNVEDLRVPHWNEPTHIQNMLSYVENGSIRMLWINGTNPLVSLPDLPRVRSLLTQPELFVVAQDIFMTETASIADVVLPAAGWGEKTGTFTNADRTVHLSHKAVDPPGEAKSDMDIFVDYSRRMGFKDKDGKPLIKFKTPEEAFEQWKAVSKGRPCDYSGMTYAQLSGGSGIQWPCNEKWPMGKERLFENAVFFTDIEGCESFGHDLETGAPLTKDQYRALNPDGRAIFKSAEYLPSPEEPDEDFPLRLSTGRNTHHFHTRTKTGRTALQRKVPEPEARISKADGEKFGIKDGEMAVIRSRRGAVGMTVRVGGIKDGQIFIPFHFGYWDQKEGEKARAGNELTITQWDPVSKQPTFKAGAVRIEKLSNPSRTGKAEIPEPQTAAIAAAAHKDTATVAAGPDLTNRERHLELWLGETHECIVYLHEIIEELAGQLASFASDREVEGGLRVMARLTQAMAEKLDPIAKRLGENRTRARHRAQILREALFPPKNEKHSPMEVLENLLGLQTYVAYISAKVGALTPTASAMWDGAFVEAVNYVDEQLERVKIWIAQQVKVRGPQTLLVPTLKAA